MMGTPLKFPLCVPSYSDRHWPRSPVPLVAVQVSTGAPTKDEEMLVRTGCGDVMYTQMEWLAADPAGWRHT